jgi:hypothetical protein
MRCELQREVSIRIMGGTRTALYGKDINISFGLMRLYRVGIRMRQWAMRYNSMQTWEWESVRDWE